MSRLTWDDTAEHVSRDQILRCERGQGNIHFPCSSDHEKDWQPYPVDPYSCYIYVCDHTTVLCSSWRLRRTNMMSNGQKCHAFNYLEVTVLG